MTAGSEFTKGRGGVYGSIREWFDGGSVWCMGGKSGRVVMCVRTV